MLIVFLIARIQEDSKFGLLCLQVYSHCLKQCLALRRQKYLQNEWLTPPPHPSTLSSCQANTQQQLHQVLSSLASRPPTLQKFFPDHLPSSRKLLLTEPHLFPLFLPPGPNPGTQGLTVCLASPSLCFLVDGRRLSCLGCPSCKDVGYRGGWGSQLGLSCVQYA